MKYPTEVEDELIDDETGIDMPSPSSNGISPALNPPGMNIPTDCWLSGWNFITDLYRILEHALARFRGQSNRSRRRSFLRQIFDDQSTATQASVRDNVLQMYDNLHDCFKETKEMTHNVRKDRFGFQAANATASLQLVRMVLFTAGGATIAERCQIASDVINAFASIPVEYLLAISTPLMYHLGGIGSILGSVFEEPLGETDYDRVRSIMLSMAQLLESLEAIHQSGSASQRLRDQIAKVDGYMASQREARAARQIGNTKAVPAWAEATGEEVDSGESHNDIGAVQDPSWSFQIPPDFLDELDWSFAFGQ